MTKSWSCVFGKAVISLLRYCAVLKVWEKVALLSFLVIQQQHIYDNAFSKA